MRARPLPSPAPTAPFTATGGAAEARRDGKPVPGRGLALWMLLAAVGSTILAGCGGGTASSPGREEDDPNYVEGQRLVRLEHFQEALADFQRVIDARDGNAPQAELEIGLIYAGHLQDPISAIFHYQRFLALAPAARQASYVRQQVEAAKRDFARTLPGSPLESQTERLQFLDTIDRLQRENDQLKNEIALLRGGNVRPGFNGTAPATPNGQPSNSNFLPPPSGITTSNSGTTAIKPAYSPLTPATTVPPKPPPAAANAGRTHIVAKGDTLYSLAARYYNDRAKWHDILEANRDQLPDEKTPLKIGMVLRIP